MACLTSPEVAVLVAKQLKRNTLRAVAAPVCLAAVADGASEKRTLIVYTTCISHTVTFELYDRRVPPRHDVVQAH